MSGWIVWKKHHLRPEEEARTKFLIILLYTGTDIFLVLSKCPAIDQHSGWRRRWDTERRGSTVSFRGKIRVVRKCVKLATP